MLDEKCDTEDLRERKMKSVMRAVVNLCQKLNLPPDVVAEGAIRGAAVTMVACGLEQPQVAEVLRDFAIKLEESSADPLAPGVPTAGSC